MFDMACLREPTPKNDVSWFARHVFIPIYCDKMQYLITQYSETMWSQSRRLTFIRWLNCFDMPSYRRGKAVRYVIRLHGCKNKQTTGGWEYVLGQRYIYYIVIHTYIYIYIHTHTCTHSILAVATRSFGIEQQRVDAWNIKCATFTELGGVNGGYVGFWLPTSVSPRGNEHLPICVYMHMNIRFIFIYIYIYIYYYRSKLEFHRFCWTSEPFIGPCWPYLWDG